MKGSVATVTAKGQVTIPAEIRKALGLKPGDKAAFVYDEKGVRIEKSSSPLRLGFGAVKPRKKPEDLRQMRRKAQKWVALRANEKL